MGLDFQAIMTVALLSEQNSILIDHVTLISDDIQHFMIYYSNVLFKMYTLKCKVNELNEFHLD